MTEQPGGNGGREAAQPPLSERLGLLTVVGPPTTVIAAVLFWYGYVATYQRFRYFGVYLELADLSNQDLLLYGTETMLPFGAVLLGFLLALLGAHLGVIRLRTARRAWIPRAVLAGCALVGVYLAFRALVGILVSRVSEEETPGVTPLSLTLGPSLLVYALYQRARLRGPRPARTRPEIAAVALAAGIAVIGLFWAATSFAGAYGESRGYRDALQLSRRPEVVLRAKTPILGLRAEDRGKRETFRYEYRDLRLLLESNGRLFLIPAHWTAGSSTVIVPYDANVQVQLIPAHRPR
ncbi:hypothetical protein [Actinomadura decatromicini]|uniref:Uncharacterized protein n=1 Tax=Actinomadura decatromicini TaxID=2604572 RepID=A0A5D3FCM5_9ACTN|nr:hypothetical protein [Actinomadura decatromicini]TYK45085.1 hypothetical protein FXF68_30860 [Actinomadura decatromicini]